MSIKLKFPYYYKTVESGQIAYPLVDLEVETEQGWQKVRFLVDSGADATTLPLFLAKEWAIAVDQGKKTIMGGVGVQSINAYPAQIRVRLKEEETNLRCFFVESETTPLLGRVDFWEEFSLQFDNQNQEIVFEKIAKPHWLYQLVDSLRSWAKGISGGY